jgi:hypothetical protein
MNNAFQRKTDGLFAKKYQLNISFLNSFLGGEGRAQGYIKLHQAALIRIYIFFTILLFINKALESSRALFM